MYPDENHARRVQSVLAGHGDARVHINDQILASWKRCSTEYGLSPEDRPNLRLVDAADLAEKQQRLRGLVSISQIEMANLYEQIAGSGFAIVLTDADGVILHYVGDPAFTITAAKCGLQVGAVWTENAQGTNGMGTCLFERKPLVVHHAQHFLTCNTILTCSAAPIFDPSGELVAVLDASAESKSSQQHTVTLINMSARSIENRLFLHSSKDHYVARFHSRPEFVSTLGEGMIAFDDGGKILAVNQSALFQIGFNRTRQLQSKNINEVFDCTVERLIAQSRTSPLSPLPIRIVKDGRRFFAVVQPPTQRVSVAGPVASKSLTDDRVRGPLNLSLETLNSGDTRIAANVARAKRILNLDIPIILRGETGVGKDIFAKAIHTASQRAAKPFVPINCAAIPETLVEAELFGYRPGAFTGASRSGHRGRILQANGGTLFLDEIGDMSVHLQGRLLRVLEDHEVIPLGGDKGIKVDFRVISSTNRDLEEAIKKKEFREDLYYRLKGISFTIPPLRERDDLARLIERILELEHGPNKFKVSPEALRRLEDYSWPGNIRELRNAICTAALFCSDGTIRTEDFPADMFVLDNVGEEPVKQVDPDDGLLVHTEREAIINTLTQSHWNVSKTAKRLKISRNTLYRKMKKHGFTPPR